MITIVTTDFPIDYLDLKPYNEAMVKAGKKLAKEYGDAPVMLDATDWMKFVDNPPTDTTFVIPSTLCLSRHHMTTVNRAITYLASVSHKRNVHLVFVTGKLSDIDLRLRRMADEVKVFE